VPRIYVVVDDDDFIKYISAAEFFMRMTLLIIK